MKLLSYNVWDYENHPYDGHDSNISYLDGNAIRYIKTERLFHEKHHRLWWEECDEITKKLWGITKKEADDYIVICSGKNTVTECEHSRSFFQHKYYETNEDTFLDHHYAHALSISLLTEVDVSIIIDGRGSLKSWSVYRGNQFIDCGFVDICGSIGENFVTIRKHFDLSGHGLDIAGKLMGLQSYGKKNDALYQKLEQYDMRNINPVFEYPTDLDVSKVDWLKTVHEYCGEMIISLFDRYVNPNERIGYSGGVAQNILWNTKLKRKYPNLVIMPHSSDEGLSLGGLEFLRQKYNLDKPSINNFPYIQSDESANVPNETTIVTVASLLAQGKIVALYQGNGEIGPRALGNRSILMDPRIIEGRNRINQIKRREWFRPFGASIIKGFEKEYFDCDYENPYMLYVGICQKENIRSVTHVDNTCRFQSVSDGPFYQLLCEFYKITSCPVLLNTSLNNSGKPIAGTIREAKEEFFNSLNIDVLVVGNDIHIKEM